jgi:hypothetical protein
MESKVLLRRGKVLLRRGARAGGGARTKKAAAAGWVAASCALAAAGALGATPALAAPAWSSPQLAPLPKDAATPGNANVDALSCSSSSSCVTGGSYSNSDEHEAPLAIAIDDGAAVAFAVPPPTGLTGILIRSVSCAPQGPCTGVGDAANEATRANEAVIVSRIGTPYAAAEAIANPVESSDEDELEGVDCPAAGGCVAVGDYLNPVEGYGYLPLVVTGSEGAWHAQPVKPPANPGTDEGQLADVSCTPSGACEAVGTYYTAPDGVHPLAASSASGWEGVAVPVTGESGEGSLEAVSCDAAGACDAVGFEGVTSGSGTPLIATQSGGQWTSEPLTIAKADTSDYLEAVSCAPEGSCAAVGHTVNEAEARSYTALVLTSSGSEWAQQELPVEAESQLTSVSCPAAGACTAVGEADRETSSAAIAVTQTGGAWEAPRELALPGAGAEGEAATSFDRVDCVSAQRCTAVGVNLAFSSTGVLPIFASSAPALEVAAPSLPGAEVGAPYSAQLSATGGTDSYTWSLASGSLPDGLTLNQSTGAISGTPTSAGSSSFAVQASDPGPPAQTSDTGQLTISVAASTADAGAGTGTPPASGKHPEPAPRPTVRIESRKLTIANGKLVLRVACKDAACKGVMSVVAKLASRVKQHGKAKTVERSVVLAKTSYTLAAGRAKTFALKLPAKTRRALVVSALLARRRHKRVEPQSATVTITVKHGTAQSKALKLAPSGAKTLKIVG